MAVSITGDGMAIAIDGNVGMTYDRATKRLTINGLSNSDRVIFGTDAGGRSKSVTIQLGGEKHG